MALCLGLPGWAGTRKVKPIWILLKQETVSGSGISWAICRSAPRFRQISMPAPHHSFFYRPDALPVAQPTASKHWRRKALKLFVANRQCSIIGLICVTCTMMCRFNLAWGWSRDTSWGNEVLISHCEFIWSMTSAYMPSLMTNNSLSKCVSLFIFIQICGFCSICGKHCKYVFIETALANNATETIVRLEAV